MEYLEHASDQDIQVFQLMTKESLGVEWLSLPKLVIPSLAEKYVNALEIEQSRKWCKCEWTIHPDDVNTKEASCRDCNAPKNEHPFEHSYKGVRMKRGEENPKCPVHTKTGFILGFFEFIFSDEMEEARKVVEL